jgi:hypothetical protein
MDRRLVAMDRGLVVTKIRGMVCAAAPSLEYLGAEKPRAVSVRKGTDAAAGVEHICTSDRRPDQKHQYTYAVRSMPELLQ